MVGHKEAMRDLGCARPTAVYQLKASPFPHGHCQPELSGARRDPHRPGSEFLA